VGEEGLEPSRANAHKILSLACIPISPLAQIYVHSFRIRITEAIIV